MVWIHKARSIQCDYKENVTPPELPKSPAGKILKRELKRSYLEGGKMDGRS